MNIFLKTIALSSALIFAPVLAPSSEVEEIEKVIAVHEAQLAALIAEITEKDAVGQDLIAKIDALNEKKNARKDKKFTTHEMVEHNELQEDLRQRQAEVLMSSKVHDEVKYLRNNVARLKITLTKMQRAAAVAERQTARAPLSMQKSASEECVASGLLCLSLEDAEVKASVVAFFDKQLKALASYIDQRCARLQTFIDAVAASGGFPKALVSENITKDSDIFFDASISRPDGLAGDIIQNREHALVREFWQAVDNAERDMQKKFAEIHVKHLSEVVTHRRMWPVQFDHYVTTVCRITPATHDLLKTIPGWTDLFDKVKRKELHEARLYEAATGWYNRKSQ